ncbi:MULTISPECIES: immunoglobulin-like domain-containing protein [Listeria]|uniref:immunoglobulin-like domain-containing protein n=1 Tax=Listeria TaxID=1637 RepID=UPI001F080F49|nr:MULTISPECIES: immunoglobulin-like domain-containing protein [Listeria]
MKKKVQFVTALATAGVFVLAPVSTNFENAVPTIQTGDQKASAATIDLLKDAHLQPTYQNGKLQLTLTGQQLANIGLISEYYTYFTLPTELTSLLDSPEVRANTTLSYSIPILSIGPIGLPPHQGTVTGDQLIIDKEHQSIGAKINHGLASVGIAATNNFTLTIDLASLGISQLPSSPDSQLEFAALSSDTLLNLNLLGNPNAAQASLETTLPDQVKPTISATDKTISVGDNFDPKAGVTASDDRDGDITNKIEVVSNNVDTTKAGTYDVTYSVTDSSGNTETKTIIVTVQDDWENFQIGKITSVNPINTASTSISGYTTYDDTSQIPSGTKIYANAVFDTQNGYTNTIITEIEYKNGYFKIPVPDNVKWQEGDTVPVYLTAVNANRTKKSEPFLAPVLAEPF